MEGRPPPCFSPHSRVVSAFSTDPGAPCQLARALGPHPTWGRVLGVPRAPAAAQTAQAGHRGGAAALRGERTALPGARRPALSPEGRLGAAGCGWRQASPAAGSQSQGGMDGPDPATSFTWCDGRTETLWSPGPMTFLKLMTVPKGLCSRGFQF